MKAWRTALIIGLLTQALPAAGAAGLPAPAAPQRPPSTACISLRADTPAPRAASTH